jgi:ATP-binding cassette subfamily B protein
VNELPDRLHLLARLWQQFNRRRRIEIGFLLVLVMLGALADVITVGAVLPFLGVLIAPERVLEQPLIGAALRGLGIVSAQNLLLPLTVSFVAAALVSGLLRISIVWYTNRLAVGAGADIGIEAYRRSLYQPYEAHTRRNSSDLVSAIHTKVNDVVFGTLLPALQFVSSALVAIAITLVLLAMDPLVASCTALFLGGSYATIVLLARRALRRKSEVIAREHVQVVKALQEGFGGIRDILLDGTQEAFTRIYARSVLPLRKAQGAITFIGQSPRYAMESIGIAFICVLALAMSRQQGGIASALPMLGALALGAQRLLPALQQSYGAWVSMAGSRQALADVLDLLEKPLPPATSARSAGRLEFRDEIRFSDVHFRYGPEGPWTLEGFNLSISKGMRIGVVGRTGSGKSTMLDILLGLLDPTQGHLLVDGKNIAGPARRQWQQIVAHVPQNIFLSDASIAENIAFGAQGEANRERLKGAARQAQLLDFVEALPEGFQTFVGERGIRLSGGQRQRIGIARALYRNASVLVFDEATSALDNATERAVMESIDGLTRDLTLVLIAHRLTTVQHCDLIVELDHGRMVASGTYAQLLETSPTFRSMAGANP